MKYNSTKGCLGDLLINTLNLNNMKRLTEEDIQKINNAVDYWNQGIFKEPSNIDVNEKGLVIYQRYNIGGASGGNCWNDDEPTQYEGEDRPNWDTLDLALKEICPEVTYLQYKDIEKLVKSNDYTDYQYYGNYDDYEIYWLSLEDLYNYLNI